MAKKILLASVLTAFLVAGVGQAQVNDLPRPGILPGSPFFFLQHFFEGIGDVFTFGEGAKAERAVNIAERRLAAAQILTARGDENAQKAIELYEEKVAEAAERAQNARHADALARVSEAISKHFVVLEGVIERVPEQAKASVQRALDSSKQGQISALQALSGVNPDRAVEAGANAAKELAAQARAHATERKAEALEQKLQHFEGVFNSFINAPQGRVDVAAKFSERMTEIVNELDEARNEAEDADIGRSEVERLRNVKGEVMDSQLAFLEDVVRENPVRAIEIYAQVVDGRLNAARRDAEKRNGEATKESLEDYNKYAEFGQRISSMAEGIRIGETTVEDLVKEATSHHLQVLEEVQQKLPVQAQQEFQRAKEAAQKVQELRPEVEQPTTPGMPQETPGGRQ